MRYIPIIAATLASLTVPVNAQQIGAPTGQGQTPGPNQTGPVTGTVLTTPGFSERAAPLPPAATGAGGVSQKPLNEGREMPEKPEGPLR
jgi:hypothetical protein